jgi:uncharacterized protein YhbP (UPF0306 family)
MNVDEPLFPLDDTALPSPPSGPGARENIQRLVADQLYAVLCVQAAGQPYGALVAFAFSGDFRHAVFATGTATRKYRALSECNHVALVIDNRPSRVDDLMQVEAVTATGHAQQVERDGDYDPWAGLLVGRHDYLESFVRADSCALFRVEVVRFLYVARFQEVSQWVPDAPS